MQVTLVPSRWVNCDLGVVNAARVSFAKERSQFLLHGDLRIPEGESGDDRLIAYLARNQHWSPLAHPHFAFCVPLSSHMLRAFAFEQPAGVRLIATDRWGEFKDCYLVGSLYGLAKALPHLEKPVATLVANSLVRHAPYSAAALGLTKKDGSTFGWRVNEFELMADAERGQTPNLFKGIIRTFRIKAPVFVARQLVKHQRELVWNEESRRYVDNPPEYHSVEEWRSRPVKNKQGSAEPLSVEDQFVANRYLSRAVHAADSSYQDLLAARVAPEQARMALPVCHMTEWWWTGSVDAFARVVRLRTDSHSQQETSWIAHQIDKALSEDLGPRWDQAKELEASREQH